MWAYRDSRFFDADHPRWVFFDASGMRPWGWRILIDLGYILAAAGKRVLCVTPDTASTVISESLAYFAFSEIDEHDVSFLLAELSLPSLSSGRSAQLRQYFLPSHTATVDVLTASLGDSQAGHQNGSEAFTPLRADSDCRYDYIFMACPVSAMTTSVSHGTAAMVCLFTSESTLTESSLAALSLPRPLNTVMLTGIVSVQLVDRSLSRGKIQETIDRKVQLAAQTYGYSSAKALIVDEEYLLHSLKSLSVIRDDESIDASPRAVGEKLAALISGEQDIQAPWIPPMVRRRYRRRVGSSSVDVVDVARVVFIPQNRAWAEWIVGELLQVGVDAALWDDSDETLDTADLTLIMTGSAEDYPPTVRARLENYRGLPEDDRPEIVHVRLPGAMWGHEPSGELVINLATEADGSGRIPPKTATRRLRAPFLRPAVSPQPTGWISRYPAVVHIPEVTNFCQPSTYFVGRGGECDKIREILLRRRLAIVNGPPGIGKSELVRRYIELFVHDYDVMWWIPAYDSHAMKLSLIQFLARHPKKDESGYTQRPLADALAALRTRHPRERWLMIYDDLTQPEIPYEVIPSHALTHVVITSRQPVGWLSESAKKNPRSVEVEELPLAPLGREEGRTLLTKRLIALDPTMAEDLLDRVEGVPITLRLLEVGLRHRLQRMRTEGLSGEHLMKAAVGEYTKGSLVKAEHTWNIVFDELSTQQPQPLGRLAIAVVKMCAFLSVDGVSLKLLRFTPMVEQLAVIAGAEEGEAGYIFLRDVAIYDSVLWLASKFNILEVDWGRTASIRIHHVIRDFVLMKMTESERRRVQTAVLRGLARCGPNDSEIGFDLRWEIQNELSNHVSASGAVESDDWQVRQWLVIQALHTALSGNFDEREHMVTVTARLRQRWSTQGLHDELLYRLDDVRARLLQDTHKPEEALEVQTSAWGGMRDSGGYDGVRAIMAVGRVGWYLQESGRFAESVTHYDISYQGLLRNLGPHHPHTLYAAHNLAYARFLAGRIRRAADMARETLAQWTAQKGWGDKRTWLSAAVAGRYLTELGEYDEAFDLLSQAHSASRQRSRPSFDIDVTIGSYQAVIRRRQGEARRALDSHRSIVNRCIDKYGEDDRTTLACQISVAADEWAVGRAHDAVERATRAARGLERFFPLRHPFHYLCHLDLAVFSYNAGLFEEAKNHSVKAVDGLASALGDQHPWTLAAKINSLTIGDQRQDHPWLVSSMDQISRSCQECLEYSHPYTQVARFNADFLAGTPSHSFDRKGMKRLIVEIPIDRHRVIR